MQIPQHHTNILFNTIHSFIHSFIWMYWRRECIWHEWCQSVLRSKSLVSVYPGSVKLVQQETDTGWRNLEGFSRNLKGIKNIAPNPGWGLSCRVAEKRWLLYSWLLSFCKQACVKFLCDAFVASEAPHITRAFFFLIMCISMNVFTLLQISKNNSISLFLCTGCVVHRFPVCLIHTMCGWTTMTTPQLHICI